MAEYGEPWNRTDYRKGCLLFNNVERPISDLDGFIAWELAERIAVCINACAGVPTEDLLSGKARVVQLDKISVTVDEECRAVVEVPGNFVVEDGVVRQEDCHDRFRKLFFRLSTEDMRIVHELVQWNIDFVTGKIPDGDRSMEGKP